MQAWRYASHNNSCAQKPQFVTGQSIIVLDLNKRYTQLAMNLINQRHLYFDSVEGTALAVLPPG